MANYQATTVSEGGKIKKGSEKEISAIMEKYNFDTSEDMTYEIVERNDEKQTSEIAVYGYGSPTAYAKDDEDFNEEVFDQFLNDISPFLAETLIVKEVGNEKCRYVCAYAYIVEPNEKYKSVSLDSAITSMLAIKSN